MNKCTKCGSKNCVKVGFKKSDGNFAYDCVYENKVIQEKSAKTNIIENLNS